MLPQIPPLNNIISPQTPLNSQSLAVPSSTRVATLSRQNQIPDYRMVEMVPEISRQIISGAAPSAGISGSF
jgi:hypothetical protein